MKTIRIEWTGNMWVASLPTGKMSYQHLPSLINNISKGDIEIAKRIEIVF